MTLPYIFGTLAAVFFIIPFLFWTVISFVDKRTTKVITWQKKAKWIVMGVCLLIFLTFLLLAIFINQ